MIPMLHTGSLTEKQLLRNDGEGPTGTSWTDHENERRDDQKLSDGTDTIVPDVSDSESDEMIVDNSSPRGGK